MKETKHCNGCDQDLPRSEFWPLRKGDKTYLRSKCKTCLSKQQNDRPIARKWKREHAKRKYHNNIAAGRKKSREDAKRLTRKRKAQVFDLLGHECVECGEDDKTCLQFDHVDGGGSKERREVGSYYALLKRILDDPDRFQVLCANCNHLKRLADNPPRSKSPHTAAVRKHQQKRKHAAIEILGDRCAACGETDERVLQFDHVNGNGRQDRQKTGRGVERCNDVIKHGIRKYQLLCANCNQRKRVAQEEWHAKSKSTRR